jgi:hypothetical protein
MDHRTAFEGGIGVKAPHRPHDKVITPKHGWHKGHGTRKAQAKGDQALRLAARHEALAPRGTSRSSVRG